MRLLPPTHIGRWGYSAAKAADESLAFAYAHEKKLPILVVRPFNVVGPRQSGRYGMVVPTFVRQALTGKPITIYGTGSAKRSFIHVKDAVRAIISLSLEKKAEGLAFNVGRDACISIKDLALRVKKQLHSSSRLQYVPYREAYAHTFDDFEEVRFRLPDIRRLRKCIGFRFKYDIDDVIRDTAVAVGENPER